MIKFFLCLLSFFQIVALFGDNQTPTVSTVQPSSSLPFEVSINLLNYSLPNGWHSGALGTWGSKCIFIAGRTNGLHGFDDNVNVNNFPPSQQSTILYVVDFDSGQVWQRSLMDPTSGLTQSQIDTLSVTSPQSYQRERTLYITGGYGIDTETGQMGTKAFLTAIDVPGLVDWVISAQTFASTYIRQTSHPLLQVTGGYMNSIGPHHPILLIFGQNFSGFYRDNSNGDYTQQVRSFLILDNGKDLYVAPAKHQFAQDLAYRRRDLNIVPVMRPGTTSPTQAYMALSGVFTETDGIWTVPVVISPDGNSSMADPTASSTFKQAMNNYVCPTAGLFSNKTEDMYVLSFGGITFGYFENGVFETDSEFPFTNQITAIKIDRDSIFSQYLMDSEYPEILSTSSNPGNPLLFGAGGVFIPKTNLPQYSNGVFALDKLLDKPYVIGYIVGGIQSSLPNTGSPSDSAASSYIFQVTLQPK